MHKLVALLTLAGVSLLPAIAAETPASTSPVPRPAGEFVIQRTNGQSQLLLSSYKGKAVVLALMYATCPHCQKTSQMLTQISKDYPAKDVQFLGAVFNEGDAMRVDPFIKGLQVGFPLGYSSIPSVLTFLKWPQSEPYYVPILVFIDKKGIIRKQVVGDEKFLAEKDQAANIKAEIDKLLKAPAGPVSSAKSKKAPKS